jgi:glutamyl-tRNA synthetase
MPRPPTGCARRGGSMSASRRPTELDLKRKKQLNMGRPPVYDRAALKLDASREGAAARRARRRALALPARSGADRVGGRHPRRLSIDAASVSDPVLIRGDGQVLYTLASVVDDVEMGVTHVVRGSDHVTNTATQIQIIRRWAARRPRFAHHSLLTGPQGEALSKRLGTLALRDLRARGVEPMALLSLMARLGSSSRWSCASRRRAGRGFELSQFGAAPTKFDENDLFPLTRAYVQACPSRRCAGASSRWACPRRRPKAFWNVARENITVLDDLKGWWRLCPRAPSPRSSPRTRNSSRRRSRCCRSRPMTPSWADWTARVKGEDRAQGQGAVHAAAQGADRAGARAGHGRSDAAACSGCRRGRTPAMRAGRIPRLQGSANTRSQWMAKGGSRASGSISAVSGMPRNLHAHEIVRSTCPRCGTAARPARCVRR